MTQATSNHVDSATGQIERFLQGGMQRLGDDTIRCSKCGRDFAGQERRPAASISGSIMGDEYTESYYFCDSCGMYTVEVYHDRFLGDGEVLVRGPVEKSEGDASVELIGKCPEPWNKKCRCSAHKSYFGDVLD